jgi:hypothetical protein
MKSQPNLMMGADLGATHGEDAMSYAEAKEIALLRQELRGCLHGGDREAALRALDRLAQMAGNDNELVAETRRWALRFAS